MLLLRLSPTRESMLVDLILDLVLRVRHVNARVRIARAHLAKWALKRRDELGVQ